jgi:DNA mismatch endonuclease, patch repair protein
MTDVVDAETRSRMMSGIKNKNTKPEMLIRQALHRRGFRYRLHSPELPGKPDLVFPRHTAVLLIHGCFWHGHDCKYFKLPSTRPQFWKDKIKSNQLRDEKQTGELIEQGWRVLIVWECATRKGSKMALDVLADWVANWLRTNAKTMHIDVGGPSV